MGFNFMETLEKIKSSPKYAELIEKMKAAAAEQKANNNAKLVTLTALKEMAEKAQAYDIIMGVSE